MDREREIKMRKQRPQISLKREILEKPIKAAYHKIEAEIYFSRLFYSDSCGGQELP